MKPSEKRRTNFELGITDIIISMLAQADMVRQSVAAGYKMTADDKTRINEIRRFLSEVPPRP